MLIQETPIPSTKPEWHLAFLGSQHLDAIHALECAAWKPPLRANRETLTDRISLGHFMLGAWQQDTLIGFASWRRGWLDLADASLFPQTFAEFSGLANSEPHNAAYVYNLCMHPEHRGKQITRALINGVIEQVRADDCLYLVGDGRCASYNGSNGNGDDGTPPSKVFRAAIDRQLQSGVSPSLTEYLADPLLHFYYRVLDCEFLWAIPDFIPSDQAAGGYRVIFCKHLSA